MREVLHDTEDMERKGLAIRRMLRILSPQLLENPMPLMITDMSSSAKLRNVVDQASDAGYVDGLKRSESLFVYRGDVDAVARTHMLVPPPPPPLLPVL